MTIWEFRCLSSGWKKANGGEGDGEARAPTQSEYEAALERFGVSAQV